jgi:glucose/mannose-6-phosphate isomerase
MSVVDLDDIAYLRSIDPADMAVRIAELPEQCREATRVAGEQTLPEEYGECDAIVILGLGGSAIGGDLVKTLVEGECGVPILINRQYDLPAFVDERTLVIASSYSGNTEEILSAFRRALDRQAKPLAITTGGELARMGRDRNLPVFTFDYESQPRAALGYSLVTLLEVLRRLNYVSDLSADLQEAVATMEAQQAEIGLEVPEEHNAAKQLARRLEGRLPVLYAAGHLTEVARRWKCQFNENSKGWAFWEALPELNHNAVVGYEFPPSMASVARVVMLLSDLYSPRLRLRMEVTGEILSDKGVPHEAIDVSGRSPLAQVLWSIHLGDYVSYYLAALRGADPTPVKTISYLKERLAQMP